jgi:serine/threonine protein phosphatase PrpC
MIGIKMAFTLSVQGPYRASNDDYAFMDQSRGFFGIADGVGSTPDSKSAARFALRYLSRATFRHQAEPEVCVSPMESSVTAIDRIRRHLRARRYGDTTLSAVRHAGLGRYISMHVGDTAIFCIRPKGRSIVFETSPHVLGNHNLVQWTPETSVPRERLYGSNVLTKVVSARTNAYPDIGEFYVTDGDIVLLASDGILDALNLNFVIDEISASNDLYIIKRNIIKRIEDLRPEDNATLVVAVH